MAKKLRIAIVGLGFGGEFVPIYLDHPDVEQITICDTNETQLNAIGDRFAVERRTTDLNEILNSDEIDAVHLLTPIPLHAQQSIAILNAGKHCACAVPMATNIDDLRAIIAAQRKSGNVYVGMETVVYGRQFLFAQEMQRNGEFGRIQFLRGAHYQDMENWPSYWHGFPPLHYATHAVSPILALTGTRAKTVHCFGSGVMREELRQQYGNPYPIETAIFELDSPTSLAAEVTRTMYQTAHQYQESFYIYGEKATFEWAQVEKEAPVVFRMYPQPGDDSRITTERVEIPDRQDLLPPEIARYTKRVMYDAGNGQPPFTWGGGHDGSHPHLVHEFVRSIVEERQSWMDAITTANWNAPGICAHESAMKGGARVEIPDFRN